MDEWKTGLEKNLSINLLASDALAVPVSGK